MNAIVIRRQLTKSEYHQIRILQGKGQWTIFSDIDLDFNGEIRQELQLEEHGKKKLNYLLIEILKDLPEKKVNGSSLVEKLAFENTNLWYYQKYRVYFNTQQALYDFESLKQYAQKYDKVYCYTHPLLDEMHKNLPSNINLIDGKAAPVKGLKKKSFFLHYVYLVFVRSLQQMRAPRLKKECIHAVMDLSMWQHYLDRKTL